MINQEPNSKFVATPNFVLSGEVYLVDATGQVSSYNVSDEANSRIFPIGEDPMFQPSIASYHDSEWITRQDYVPIGTPNVAMVIPLSRWNRNDLSP